MTIESGTEIIGGKFVVHELLGRGAFGEVYRATLRSTGGMRAVKVVRKDAPGVGSSVLDDYHDRFTAECQSAERVKHPNVLTVYDMFEEADAVHAVLEYAAGGSLSDLIATARALPIERAIEILLDAALDMAGNAIEWVADWYDAQYARPPRRAIRWDRRAPHLAGRREVQRCGRGANRQSLRILARWPWYL